MNQTFKKLNEYTISEIDGILIFNHSTIFKLSN